MARSSEGNTRPLDASAYESLFEHHVDPVFLTRRDGTILRANAAARRALGYSEEEIRRLAPAEEPLRALLAECERTATTSTTS